MTSEKIQVFSKDPLREIRERHCTFKSRSQRGLPSVCEDMLFDMSNHSSAKSSIAKDLLKRVANDVKTFAISANRNEEPGIKGFSAKQCEALVDLGSRSGCEHRQEHPERTEKYAPIGSYSSKKGHRALRSSCKSCG